MAYNPFERYSIVPFCTDFCLEILQTNATHDNQFIVTNYFSFINKGSNTPLLVKIAGVFKSNIKNHFFEYKEILVPFEVTSEIPIGSIWVNGICTQKYDFPVYQLYFSNDDLFYLESSNPEFRKKEIEQNIKTIPSVDWGDYSASHKSCVYLKNDNITFIIPNLMLFNSYFGSSKTFSNALLSLSWESLEKRLRLDYENPTAPENIILPYGFIKNDAILVSYIKNNHKTRNLIYFLNNSIITKYQDGKEIFYLPNIKLWHDETINFKFHGVEIAKNTVLCTEIIGMSFPTQETVIIDYEESIPEKSNNITIISNGEHERNIKQNEVIKIAAQSSIDNRHTRIANIYIDDFGTSNIIKKNIIQVAEKDKNRNIKEAEKIPDNFTTGERLGTGGDTGRVRTHLVHDDEAAVTTQEKTNYLDKLVQDFYEIGIDFTPYLVGINGELKQSTNMQEYKTQLNQSKFPYIICILRFQHMGNDYVMIDCEPDDIYSTSALIVEVPNDNFFKPVASKLGYDWAVSKNDEIRLPNIIATMAENSGLPYDKKTSSFKLLQDKIKIERVKHGSASNWVSYALAKIKKVKS